MRTSLLSLGRVIAAAGLLLFASTLHAELKQVESFAWSDPGGMGKQYVIRYTIDTETGLLHGRYEERWVTDDSLKYEATYVQGKLDGVEVVYPSSWVNIWDTITTYWDLGVKRRVEYAGEHPDGTPSHVGSEVYTGDLRHSEHMYYFENGGVHHWYEEDFHIPSALVLYLAQETYYDNGNLQHKGWSREVIDETGKRKINLSPYEKNFAEDGTPTYYREFNNRGELHGVLRRYWTNGNLREETTYVNGVKEGPYMSYHETGPLQSIVSFSNGLKHGPGESYFETGELSGTFSYSNGQSCGTTTYYRKDGTVYQEFQYGACAPLDTGEEFDEEADPDDSHILTGIVVDRVTGMPVGGVAVSAGSVTDTTDIGGAFRLELGSSTYYSLSLSREGYNTRTGNLDMSGYQERHIRVRLVPVGSDDKPVVADVSSSNGDVFFAGLGARTAYSAEVNWGQGTGESVKFGDWAGTLAGGTATLDFAVDNLGPSLQPQTLNVVATNKAGVASEPFLLNPVVAPQPPWLKALGSFSGDASPDAAGYMSFKLSRQWPSEPVTLALTPETLGTYAWAAWQVVPFVGGQNFGLNAVQALMEAEFKTDGNGSMLLGGQAGVTAGGQSIAGKLGGKGYFSYRPGKGIIWTKGSLIVGVTGEIQKEAGLVTVIPALQNAVNLPVVGRGLAWLNNTAKVEGKIGMGAEMEFAMIDHASGLTFDRSEGTLSTGITVGLSGGPDSLKVALEGFGEAKAVFQLPADPGYVKSVEATLGANLKVTTWLFEKTFTASHTFRHPDSGSSSIPASQVQDFGFQPVDRSFLSAAPYHQLPSRLYRNLEASGIWNVKVGSVFPFTDISLSPHENAFVFSYFDPARETLQATELRYFDSYRIEYEWTSDTQADLQPCTSHSVAWMRIKDPAMAASSDLEDMAAAMEVVWAPRGGQPVPMSDNDYLDFEPALVASASGDVLFWQSNPGNQMVGTDASPTTVHFAEGYSFSGFSEFGEVPHAFVDAQDFAHAASSGNLAIAWMQDMDNDLATVSDQEVFLMLRKDGSWSMPQRLTDNDLTEHFLVLGSDADGGFHVFWEAANAVYRRSGNITTEAIPAVSGKSVQDVFLARNQHLPDVLVLTDTGDAMETSLLRYLNNGWTQPLRLSAPFDWDHVDLRGFRRDERDYRYYFVGLWREGDRTDLVDANVSLSTMWTGLDIALPEGYEPPSPAPGTMLEIPVVLTNSSYEDQVNPVVGLYAGEAKSTENLATVTYNGTLGPGDSGEAVLQWQCSDSGFRVPLVVSRVSSGTSPVGPPQELPVSLYDLAIQHIELEETPDGAASLSVHVHNEGPYAATGLILEILEGKRKLGIIPLPGLYPGKKAVLTKTLWPDLDFEKAYPLLTVALAGSHTEDRDPSNNAGHFQVPILPLWKDAASAGQWLLHDRIGLIFEAPDNWIYHELNGWQQVIGETTESMHVFDGATRHWWWVSAELYPWIYDYELGWVNISE